jgi:hypothetical protein
MFRLLFLLLALTAGVFAADGTPAAPPRDFFDYSFWQVAILLGVGMLMTLVMVPVCLIGWAIFLFILVFILKMFGITPAALLMKLAQRQMMGRGKGLVWQLAILICMPAGVAGLWIATKIFGVPAQSSSLLVSGAVCGILAGVGFVYLAKAFARRMSRRMMGGMQAEMMAKMMKMRRGE